MKFKFSHVLSVFLVVAVFFSPLSAGAVTYSVINSTTPPADEPPADTGGGGGGGGGWSGGGSGGGGGIIYGNTQVGCGAGNKYNTVTGQICPVDAGCGLGQLYSTVTGQLCPSVNTGSSPTPTYLPPGFAFLNNLKRGMRHADVKYLQYFLNANGFQVSRVGTGSPGYETTYFGLKTQLALKAFQRSKGITPVLGFFGFKTRTIVNAMLGL